MIANDVIARVRVHLKDQAGTRWPDAELLLWLQDGVDTIGDAFPAEASVMEVITLQADSRQVIPSHWRKLVRLERNVGGREIRRVDRYASNVARLLNNTGATVLEYWQDDVSDTEYWVYPKLSAPTQVEAYGSVRQPPIASLGQTLLLQDSYRMALVDYVMSAAISKDAEYADNLNVAAAWAQSFNQKTGIKLQGEKTNPLPEVQV